MLRENNVNTDSKISEIKFSYTDVMMNMKLLSLVTPPSIYHIGLMEISLVSNMDLYIEQNKHHIRERLQKDGICWYNG